MCWLLRLPAQALPSTRRSQPALPRPHRRVRSLSRSIRLSPRAAVPWPIRRRLLPLPSMQPIRAQHSERRYIASSTQPGRPLESRPARLLLRLGSLRLPTGLWALPPHRPPNQTSSTILSRLPPRADGRVLLLLARPPTRCPRSGQPLRAVCSDRRTACGQGRLRQRPGRRGERSLERLRRQR
jgi:hypothetical protein